MDQEKQRLLNKALLLALENGHAVQYVAQINK